MSKEWFCLKTFYIIIIFTCIIKILQEDYAENSYPCILFDGQSCAFSCAQLQQLERKCRDEALAVLKNKGLTIRQIERLTGINRGIIQKVK